MAGSGKSELGESLHALSTKLRKTYPYASDPHVSFWSQRLRSNLTAAIEACEASARGESTYNGKYIASITSHFNSEFKAPRDQAFGSLSRIISNPAITDMVHREALQNIDFYRSIFHELEYLAEEVERENPVPESAGLALLGQPVANSFSPFSDSARMESPDQRFLAEIKKTCELRMGGPIAGDLTVVENGTDSTPRTIEVASPSFIWSDDSKYLAFNSFQHGEDGLSVYDPATNSITRVGYGGGYPLEFYSFDGHIIEGICSPNYSPKAFRIDWRTGEELPVKK